MTFAILVYHRIGGPAFHDVTPEAFASHLELLSRLGARPAPDGPEINLPDGPSVLFSFDDGTADHMQAAAMLESAGFRGLFLIPAGRLGEDGRLSAHDARRLAERGHHLGAHGLSHRRFDRMTVAEIESELTTARHILSQLAERPVEWLAPPGGLFHPRLLELAAQAGYDRVRGMEWGYAPLLAEGRLPGFPITRRTGLDGFGHILTGQAPRWHWRLKRLARGLAGETLWDWMRERLG
jgi:peptidoglycan/xylan/chitin deacetylase (PgdA/CDA1 family)